jgi:hypothetical protein
MSQGKEMPGITVGGDFKLNSDPKLRRKIINAVRKIQKDIGLDGYIICHECSLGISGNPKTTPPEYIAGYCKGNCKMLQNSSDEE